MENTPLELYETAYKLHYSEHRISDAIVYYQRLIKEFPESNECGYSVIQLQKIKSSEIAGDLRSLTAPKKSSGKLTAIFIMIIMLLSGAAGYGYYHLNKRFLAEQARVSIALNALSKMSRGNLEDALSLLNDLKSYKKDDILPYELCADIYRKDNKFDRARFEYVTFFQINPMRTPSNNELWFMDINESQKYKAHTFAKPQPEVEQTPSQPQQPQSEPISKKPAVSRVKKKAPGQQPPSPGKSKDGLYLVNPDSISYF